MIGMGFGGGARRDSVGNGSDVALESGGATLAKSCAQRDKPDHRERRNDIQFRIGHHQRAEA